jgi:hypothetical protein
MTFLRVSHRRLHIGDDLAKNNFLDALVKRAWVYYVTTVAATTFGYFNLLIERLSPLPDYARLSLAQCLLLAANLFFFAFIKRPQLLPASEAPDTSVSPPRKAYEELNYTSDTWEKAKKHADESLWQFRGAWLFVLSSWTLLYVTFFFSSFRNEQPQGHIYVALLLDMLNVASHAAIVACYVILARDTTGHQRISPLTCGFLVMLFFGIPELGVVSILSAAPNSAAQTYLVIVSFGAVIGVFGGMFLGLFVGQLDNEHLGAPIWLLALLFGYAAMQPLYPLLHGTIHAAGVGEALSLDMANLPESVKKMVESAKSVMEHSRTVLIGIAGLFKLILCGFLYRSFTNGRLLFYFARKRAIADKVDEEWANFQKMMKGQDSAQP